MDPELKILLTNSLSPLLFGIAAGIPAVIIGWLLNKSAGRPMYNAYKVARLLSLVVGLLCIYMTLQKDDMDHPFWQPIIGVLLAFMFWSSRIPLMQRTIASWDDEQAIYRGRKEKLNT